MRYRKLFNEDASGSARQFATWFAGSRVVDDQGRPLRVFHGTGSGDIASFDITKANAEALFGPGFYFTDNPGVAGSTGEGKTENDIYTKADFQLAGYAWQGRKYDVKEPLSKKQMAYAKRLFGSKHVQDECYEDIGMRNGWRTAYQAFESGEEAFRKYLAGRYANPWLIQKLKVFKELVTTPTVYPVFLRIVHPFDVDAAADIAMLRRLWDGAEDHHETFENASAGWQKSTAQLTGATAWEWLSKRVLGGNKAEANQVLMRLGYDGIHHTGGYNIGTMGQHGVWIAFHPNQIKSVWSKGFNPDANQISERARW